MVEEEPRQRLVHRTSPPVVDHGDDPVIVAWCGGTHLHVVSHGADRIPPTARRTSTGPPSGALGGGRRTEPAIVGQQREGACVTGKTDHQNWDFYRHKGAQPKIVGQTRRILPLLTHDLFRAWGDLRAGSTPPFWMILCLVFTALGLACARSRPGGSCGRPAGPR